MIRFRPFAAIAFCGIVPLGAQIVPAGTGVALSGNVMTIPSDLGCPVGVNLFHTFTSFNLSNGQTAVFTADPILKIENVISRVTGVEPSNIDGTIRSQIPGANLFLMNPNGIFFGPNATLDVSGAFVATTADYLRLGSDNDRFYASDLGGKSHLVSHPPDAFGFLGSRPAPIKMRDSQFESFGGQGGLPGRSVALVAGDVSLCNSAELSGDVVVVSTGGAGEVFFDAGLEDPVPVIDPGMEMGRISLRNSEVNAAADASDVGFVGRLLLSGGSLTLNKSSITSNNFDLPEAPDISLNFSGAVTLKSGSSIKSTGVDGAGAGADISLKAGSLIAGSGGSSLSTSVFDTGKSGNISLNIEGQIKLGAGSVIETSASLLATAPAGHIDITAGSVSIDGGLSKDPSGIRSQTDAISPLGIGGNINITIRSAGTIKLTQHGSIDALTTSESTARGGNISINADGLLIDPMKFPTEGTIFLTGVSANTSGDGDAGSLTLDVGELTILRGGRIESSSKSVEGSTASGDGGIISIHAGEILIDGTGALDSKGKQLRTGVTSFASEEFPSIGASGSISVNAKGDITLRNGGLIDTSTFGTGKAGEVCVQGRNISIDRRITGIYTGIGSDTSLEVGGGEAGSVRVIAENRITLKDGGLISAATLGSGKAGEVTVEAGEISISGMGAKNADVVTPESGIVAVGDSGSSGAGGDVRVTATRQLLISDGGTIGAEALGTGSAGDVNIHVGANHHPTHLEECGTVSAGSMDIGVGGIHLSGGNLTVRSLSAGAGNLCIMSDSGVFSERSSDITASAGTDGGNITIATGGVILLRDSKVTADAKGTGGNIDFLNARHLVLNQTPVSASAKVGNGGRIEVMTGTFFASASPLSVNSELGAPGTVEIRTLDTLGGGQETEEEELLDPDDILQPDCALRNPDIGGSFTKGGKGGTRRLPGGYLPSFRIIE